MSNSRTNAKTPQANMNNESLASKIVVPKIFILFSYLLSILAFFMFIFTTFFSNITELRIQGIYWFGIATICALLPSILPLISKLKLLDLEIEFREKLEKVEKRIEEVEEIFFSSFENFKREESSLPTNYIEQRNEYWDRYDERMQNASKEKRFEMQRVSSLDYLKKFNLTVQDLKERLTQLGFYAGTIDNVFSQDLADAIENFQRLNNMRHVDGMFGELTYAKIVEVLRDISKRQGN